MGESSILNLIVGESGLIFSRDSLFSNLTLDKVLLSWNVLVVTDNPLELANLFYLTLKLGNICEWVVAKILIFWLDFKISEV